MLKIAIDFIIRKIPRLKESRIFLSFGILSVFIATAFKAWGWFNNQSNNDAKPESPLNIVSGTQTVEAPSAMGTVSENSVPAPVSTSPELVASVDLAGPAVLSQYNIEIANPKITDPFSQRESNIAEQFSADETDMKYEETETLRVGETLRLAEISSLQDKYQDKKVRFKFTNPLSDKIAIVGRNISGLMPSIKTHLEGLLMDGQSLTSLSESILFVVTRTSGPQIEWGKVLPSIEPIIEERREKLTDCTGVRLVLIAAMHAEPGKKSSISATQFSLTKEKESNNALSTFLEKVPNTVILSDTHTLPTIVFDDANGANGANIHKNYNFKKLRADLNPLPLGKTTGNNSTTNNPQAKKSAKKKKIRVH